MAQHPKIVLNARVPLLEFATIASYYQKNYSAENKTEVLRFLVIDLCNLLVAAEKVERVENAENAYEIIESLGRVSKQNQTELLKALREQDQEETEKYKHLLDSKLADLEKQKENQNESNHQH